ncbi:MAG: hypothetical protein JW856_00290 [Dehalococcoidales bacterium]|nr:hypothetical protein [Dehalococcoidales bacterium]
MNTTLDTMENPSGYTPEESALLFRLRVFVNLRWFAIVTVLVASLIASLGFRIDFPTEPVYIICLFLAAFNTLLFYQVRSLKKEETGQVIGKATACSNIHILLDLLALTILIHFTGGIENPFIFFFVIHSVVASITLHYRATYILATIAIIMVLALVGLEYAGWIPHYNLKGFADPTLYRNAKYVLSVLLALSAVLYGTTYMTAAVSGELKKRQRQVTQLGTEILNAKIAEAAREKQMQEQLVQAEKLTSLGQLSASIAHEINNPLSGVLVYNQLLYKKIKNDSASKDVILDYLSKMEAELQRSTKLVGNLLDFARQSPSTFLRININEVINHALELSVHTAKIQKIQVSKELAPSLPDVTGDFDQLQQVFTNLILNALQAMPEGGKLTLRSSLDETNLKIEVQDTGYGISPENMRKLFTPFFTTKQEVKGVGLGLAVSYGIVRRHHGKIEVQSKEGEGTTFTVYLPLKYEESEK